MAKTVALQSAGSLFHSGIPIQLLSGLNRYSYYNAFGLRFGQLKLSLKAIDVFLRYDESVLSLSPILEEHVSFNSYRIAQGTFTEKSKKHTEQMLCLPPSIDARALPFRLH